jgi:hypothetical protein
MTRIEKAHRFIAAASVLLDAGFPDISVGRSYYAMFTAAQAILERDGGHEWRHESVRLAFVRRYLPPSGPLPPSLERYLAFASDARLSGDYDPAAIVSTADAALLIRWATEFVDAVDQLLTPS